MTTTPQEMTAKEWLEHLPEPLRTEALEACERWPNEPDKKCHFIKCVDFAFYWRPSGEYDKWNKINDKLFSGEILPVEPQAEKLSAEPMKLSQQAINAMTKPSERIAFLEDDIEGFKKLFQEQNNKLEALQKELDTRCPKQIEDKQPEPAPQESDNISQLIDELKKADQTLANDGYVEWCYTRNAITWAIKELENLGKPVINPFLADEPAPVKLPVTVEEVIKYGKSLQGKDKEFYKVTLTVSFLTEKEAKKFQATKILSLIAEAQNEMCERGGTAWVAYANGSKIEIADFAFSMMDFEIYFHSEQGLKDCIAANEQLWKDYLRIN